MTWADKKAAIRSAFAAIMLDSAQDAVAWEDEPRPYGDPVLLLDVISSNQESSHTVRTVNGIELDLTHYAMRQFSVQVKLESCLQVARDISDQIKLRTRRQAFLAPLHAIGVDLVDPDAAGETTKASYDLDGQRIDVFVFDLPMRGMFSDTDPDALGTIGTVNATGTINPGTISIPIQATE